ncbi:hypothetical protein OUZ56_004938 [Daphnia magna]|uniref:Uncharacterized protein n=1 Tax=Daphnia magna TaxID=35525 RepID=A0ABQ9YRB0_9CRUS|nr:hypothetical protein OUZ56_004938 [Daphnia magna]
MKERVDPDLFMSLFGELGELLRSSSEARGKKALKKNCSLHYNRRWGGDPNELEPTPSPGGGEHEINLEAFLAVAGGDMNAIGRSLPMKRFAIVGLLWRAFCQGETTESDRSKQIQAMQLDANEPRSLCVSTN